MPVLPAETDAFPDSLLEPMPTDLGVGRSWYVLHTKPRQEKSLARILLEKHAPFYLPQIPKRRVARGRVVTSYLPLFPGYVFQLASPEERLAALKTQRVLQALPVDAQDRLWDDLRQIRRLLASGEPVTPEDRLEPGDLVEVQSGPLAGLRGTILRTASGRRFVVQVNFIQRGASVVLDDLTLVKVT
jgi:transcriptional antiterminator RfaH